MKALAKATALSVEQGPIALPKSGDIPAFGWPTLCRSVSEQLLPSLSKLFDCYLARAVACGEAFPTQLSQITVIVFCTVR
jgi:hypothetical protein